MVTMLPQLPTWSVLVWPVCQWHNYRARQLRHRLMFGLASYVHVPVNAIVLLAGRVNVGAIIIGNRYGERTSFRIACCIGCDKRVKG